VGLERVVALAIAEVGAEPQREDWERPIADIGTR
jgi:hypothetical protein